MHNSKLGNAFEQKFTQYLSSLGYWVTFLQRDRTGAQPFDFIASKNNSPLVGDCKTCKKDYISIDRLQINQISSFEKWLACKNSKCIIAVEHNAEIYIVDYTELKEKKKVYLTNNYKVGV